MLKLMLLSRTVFSLTREMYLAGCELHIQLGVGGGGWGVGGGGKLEVMASSPFGCAALSMTLHKVKINAPNPKSG